MVLQRMNRSVINAISPPLSGKEVVDEVFKKRQLRERSKYWGCWGWTWAVLSFSPRDKNYTSNITAVVTVFDDGGSSGRLREEAGVLPSW